MENEIQTNLYDFVDLLSEFSKIATKKDEYLDKVANLIAEYTNSDTCEIYFLENERLIRSNKLDYTPENELITKEKMILRAIKESNFICSSSYIIMPITLYNETFGAILITFTNNKSMSTEYKYAILNISAYSIAHFILKNQCNKLIKEKEKEIEKLRIILEITNIIQTPTHLEDRLMYILTSITMKEGLGFNRAALFVFDEEKKTLTGVMAIGPDNLESAREIWNRAINQNMPLEKIIQEYAKLNKSANFALDKKVKNLIIYTTNLSETDIIYKIITEKEVLNIKSNENQIYYNSIINDYLEFKNFAAIPMIASNKLIGVIFVDNKYTGKEITQEDINYSVLLSNQAALAIEKSMIYENLEKSNKELLEAKENLLRTETLAKLGSVSAQIAHDIRTPLVTIGGFANLLKDAFGSHSKERRYIRIIREEIKRVEYSLNEILNFVKDPTLNLEENSINLTIEKVLELFEDELAERNIKVNTYFNNLIPKIKYDEYHIKEVIINVIKNAIDAMPNGGQLSIKTNIIENAKQWVSTEIQDTGEGITKADISKIFEPFFSTKVGGTGLGLAISQNIIYKHKGKMKIESKRGKGTLVKILLPYES